MTLTDVTTDTSSSTLDKPEESIQCQAFIRTTLVIVGITIPLDATDQCPRKATQQMLFTCCGAIAYACDEHATSMPNITNDKAIIGEMRAAMECPQCGHVCLDGVCYHVVTTPL
jgi:hypothetical protein